MQFFLLVALQGLLLCSAFHHTVKDKIGVQVAKQQRSIDRDAQLFEEFVRDHNRTYEADEYKRRFDIFRKNLDEIDRRNAEYEQPVHGITKFSDWTSEEFQRLLGYRRRQELRSDSCTQMSSIPEVTVPGELDYRQQNLVTAVKNQGDCGSCWSFSCTGNIEGQYAKKYKKLESFSEQQLLDCISDQDCNSGYTISGGESYVISTGGIMTEADYPYLGEQQSCCSFDPTKVKAKLSGCEDWSPVLLAAKDEDSLKKVLVSRGPLSVALCGSAILNYHGGIVHGDDCNQNEVNHAVLLIGYGTENGTPYWLLKNSWGRTSWGEDGYFRIQYGVDCLGMMSSDSEIINAVIA